MKSHTLALVAALSLAAPSVLAGEPTVASILERYRATRPSPEALSIYRLDWARDLDAAKRRAAAEKRPIVLVVVDNISGGGDIFSGHC